MADAKTDKDETEDKPAEGAAGEGEAAPEATGKLKRGKKKLIIIGAVVTLLLLGGAGAGLYFTGMIGGHKEAEAGKEDEAKKKDRVAVFYDLGDMIVNLSTDGKRPSMLKIKVSLELGDDKDKAALDKVKPRVLDNFQGYMRELRVEDLKGSAGLYRLREELLLRVAEAVHPAKVYDVLITEMLVQ